MVFRLIFKKTFANDPPEDGIQIVDGQIVNDLHKDPIKNDSVNASDANVLVDDIFGDKQSNDHIEGAKGRPHGLDKYLQFIKDTKNIRTYVCYKSDVRVWSQYARSMGKTLYNISVKDIRSFLLQYSVTSRNRLLAVLKSVSKWYKFNGHDRLYNVVSTVNYEKIIYKTHNFNGQFDDLKGYVRLLVEQSDRRGVWIGVMLLCGLKISEIKRATAGPNWVVVNGKKSRQIPAPSWLTSVMQKVNYAVCPNVIRVSLRKINKSNTAPRLKHSGTSIYREMYIAKLIEKGININQISALTGNRSLSHFRRHLVVGGNIDENLIM